MLFSVEPGEVLGEGVIGEQGAGGASHRREVKRPYCLALDATVHGHDPVRRDVGSTRAELAPK
jgi:hypothetical protein